MTGSGDRMFICSGDLTLVGSGGDLTMGESSKKWSLATEALRCDGMSTSSGKLVSSLVSERSGFMIGEVWHCCTGRY